MIIIITVVVVFICRFGVIRGDEAITNEGKRNGKLMQTIVQW